MNDNINKLVLGTVQFGLNYGINNSTGQILETEAHTILDHAYHSGIRVLDTSSAYGNSEIVLGNILKCNDLKFRIISKYPQSSYDVTTMFNRSLERLHMDKLYGYLIHHFEFYQSYPYIWDDIQYLKGIGKIQKIGFSLYNVEQLQYLLEKDIKFDLLQFPFNLFDRQFEPYLKMLKERGVEIHTRSVFLQGLFFKQGKMLKGKLAILNSYLIKLHEYCLLNSISLEKLALSFVTSNPYIDGVLIGVDNPEQLCANINALKYEICKQDIDFIHSIKVEDKNILNPVNWK